MNLFKTEQAERLWNKRFVQLVSIEVLHMMGTYLTNPVVSGFAISLGASIAIGGVLAGLMAIMALVARPITGWLADKISKKTFLIIATILVCIACFGCSISQSVEMIAFFRILQGFGFAFKSAVLISLVSLSVPQSRLGQAVGWAGLAQTGSMALGPLLGAQIIALWGYRWSFFTGGALILLGLVIVLIFKMPPSATNNSSSEEEDLDSKNMTSGNSEDQNKKAKRFSIRDFIYVPNIPVAVMSCLAIVPHGVAVTLILTVGELRGIPGISLYFSVYALVALFSKPLAGRLTDSRGTKFVLIPALTIEFCAALVMAYMGSLIGVAIAGILMGVGQASAYSAIQAESVRGVAQDELGRASNTFYIGTDIGMGFGPMGESAVLQQFGVTAMFWVAALMVALAMAVLLFRPSKGNATQ